MEPTEPTERLERYLWDPSSDPAPEVEALERSLAPLRFDPARAPLPVPASPTVRPRARRVLLYAAAAAALLAVAGAGLWQWRLSWPDGRAWRLRSDSLDARLGVGANVTVPQGELAVGNVARIGTMRVAGGSSIALRHTSGLRHRLRLDRGEVHVRVWAPPLSVVFETPAGEVIDMGCEFRLSVSGDTSTVTVLSGWVQLDNGIDEILVPAGTSTTMSSTRAPGVPVFDDAVGGFRDAVRAFEETGDTHARDRFLAAARPRDVFTLLHLADNHRRDAEVILGRAAELSPPPPGVTIAGVLAGSREDLWDWMATQKLPPPKSSWWKNWRDALPFWLSER